jgi:hypothetical protein
VPDSRAFGEVDQLQEGTLGDGSDCQRGDQGGVSPGACIRMRICEYTCTTDTDPATKPADERLGHIESERPIRSTRKTRAGGVRNPNMESIVSEES